MAFQNYVEAFCSLVSEESTRPTQWSILDCGINSNDSLYDLFVNFLRMQEKDGQIDLERAFLCVICILNRFLACSGICLTQSNVLCLSTISLFLHDKLINDFYEGLDYWCNVNEYSGERMLKQELLFFSTINYNLLVTDNEIDDMRCHLKKVYQVSCLSPLALEFCDTMIDIDTVHDDITDSDSVMDYDIDLVCYE